MTTPTKWHKSQRQAFIDKRGPIEGLLLFVTGKKLAAQARWKAFYRDQLSKKTEEKPDGDLPIA